MQCGQRGHFNYVNLDTLMSFRQRHIVFIQLHTMGVAGLAGPKFMQHCVCAYLITCLAARNVPNHDEGCRECHHPVKGRQRQQQIAPEVRQKGVWFSAWHKAAQCAEQASLQVSHWCSCHFHAQCPHCMSSNHTCTHLCTHGHVGFLMWCGQV